ncbi:MAG: twin-arginine translocation signal domain-containing protein [bacterium]
MKKTVKTPRNSEVSRRRSFLKGAAITTAAVGSGALAANALAEQADTEKTETAKQGYQESDHVKEYYRLARF